MQIYGCPQYGFNYQNVLIKLKCCIHNRPKIIIKSLFDIYAA